MIFLRSCEQLPNLPSLLQESKLTQDIEPCGHSKRQLKQSDVTNVLTYTRFGDYFIKTGTTMTDELMNTMHKVATIATMAMFLAPTSDLFKGLFPKSATLATLGRDAALFKIPDKDKLLVPTNPLTNDERERRDLFLTHYTSDSFLSLANDPSDDTPVFTVASLGNFFAFALKVRANEEDSTLLQWPLLMNELKKQYQSKGDFPGSDSTAETLEVKDGFVLPQVQQQLESVEFPSGSYKTITAQIMKGVDDADIKQRM